MTVGTRPSYIAIDQNSALLFVVNTAANKLSVIDTLTNRRMEDIPVGTNPVYVVIDPVNALVSPGWVFVSILPNKITHSSLLLLFIMYLA